MIGANHPVVRNRGYEMTKKVLAPLDAQRSALDKQLQDAVKKAVGGSGLKLPGLDKLFRR